LKKPRLGVWAAASLASIFCAVAGFASYRIYYRMRWYETQFNNLILDPYQLNAFPSGAAPAKPDSVKRVVFFGDSRAAFWPAPELDGFEFINRGLDAQSAVQAAGRFAEHVAPQAPDILVVQVGVNDLRVAALYPEKEQEIYARCLEHIHAIVLQARQLGSIVILTTIFPTGEANLIRKLSGQAERLQRLIEEANAEFSLLAGDGVIVLDSAAVLAGEDDRLRREFRLDELHMNAQGYAALNQALLVALLSETQPEK
jgi:lysophospholipase L1-like esterase